MTLGLVHFDIFANIEINRPHLAPDQQSVSLLTMYCISVKLKKRVAHNSDADGLLVSGEHKNARFNEKSGSFHGPRLGYLIFNEVCPPSADRFHSVLI